MPEPSNQQFKEFLPPSPEVSITSTSNSTYTYSTSALGTDIESSSSTYTEDTLSMITTPWTTESDDVKTFVVTDTADITASLISWPSSLLSTTTVPPQSSTSYGFPSPSFNTDCNTTVTIFNSNDSFSASNSIRPIQKDSTLPSETFSSWTLESFTSAGWLSDSKVVRVKYPWSESTMVSGTDVYPSSLNSFTSRKGSRVTLATPLSETGEKDHVTPIHYVGLSSRPKERLVLGLSSRPEERLVLDWRLKLNDMRIVDALNAIIAV